MTSHHDHSSAAPHAHGATAHNSHVDAVGPDSPAEFWEARYVTHRNESGQIWSGRVNATVEHEVLGLTPGAALELGCGEGADALWLASQGWKVTALDISANALAVAAAKAAEQGLADRIEWVQTDLDTWHPSAEYDLVTAAFFHSPVELEREAILRRAASAVAPGGRLLIVGHAAFPPDSELAEHDQHGQPLPSTEEVLASLALPDGWVIETNGLYDRTVPWKDGRTLAIQDTVVRVRRER
ncbi:class I SAM-dependent methyltransferase [Mycetocola manganoxydans]|uniref:Class I SAM-dependent methyltransferase n=1 Tax=Mycetocola manganoxydans TaxID=699879 RepID=A0A3L6ZTX2_9MICO|nr:class I SAM-dependent methyltransferase [Mycetocola manganoxydans]RLP71426.1 class I SAM-dependent methyltransferase [Mycetocola manganoxydans]GHD46441.1 hypothetical protein GCM10008097_16410 [Mycetocola manganoxydans]